MRRKLDLRTPSEKARELIAETLREGDLTVEQRLAAAEFFLGEMQHLRAIVEMLGAPERKSAEIIPIRRAK